MDQSFNIEKNYVAHLQLLLNEEAEIRGEIKQAAEAVLVAEEAATIARERLQVHNEAAPAKLESIRLRRKEVLGQYYNGQELEAPNIIRDFHDVVIKDEPTWGDGPSEASDRASETSVTNNPPTPKRPRDPPAPKCHKTAPQVPISSFKRTIPIHFGQYLANCPIIVFDGNRWVELRCPECGTNAGEKGIYLKRGLVGMRLHLMYMHDHRGMTDREALKVCSFREVSTDEVDEINEMEMGSEPIEVLRCKRKRGRDSGRFHRRVSEEEDDSERDIGSEDDTNRDENKVNFTS